MKLRVFRWSGNTEHVPRYDEFLLEKDPDVYTVLDALKSIRATHDPSLAFRTACGAKMCGSCAMLINNKIKLACATPLTSFKGTITLEPLPNLPLVTDLIVNLSPFWERLFRVRPLLETEADEHQVITSEVQFLVEQFGKCICCAICFSVCPVMGRDEMHLGPAALLMNYRFLVDPRDKNYYQRLDHVDHYHGIWGCDTVFRCTDVCPREIPITQAIIFTRKALIKEKLLASM